MGFMASFLGILWKGQIYKHASLLLGFPGETRRAQISWLKTTEKPGSSEHPVAYFWKKSFW